MKRLIAILIASSMLAGCSDSDYRNITADKAKNMVEEGQVEVIDVRTPAEFKEGHIPGAESIPLKELGEKLTSLDRKGNYLIVCKGGGRSADASTLLNDENFKNIYNMTGGMDDWNGEIEK
ncbi:rhodanese-like domain-containing protein [Mesobacillus zeae]|uniref:Rhodanese-like domain-containing protein n=1 Tax=Mesobacillus zeae TaxID=1917180 RepID=A0A398B4Y7_9BACI|nr:rhodanese-like domain-containing protein [Mesobacillus zeae]RID83888.1 rhodanese-like domain-containing protein [Mesobacillus zeae]